MFSYKHPSAQELQQVLIPDALPTLRGYTMSSVNQTKVAPKTVRDNPGAYRSHYAFYPRYVGGK